MTRDREIEYGREIEYLENKIKQLEEQKQSILNYINNECVYDEHLKGYCLGMSTGQVKTLVLKIKEGK